MSRFRVDKKHSDGLWLGVKDLSFHPKHDLTDLVFRVEKRVVRGSCEIVSKTRACFTSRKLLVKLFKMCFARAGTKTPFHE